MFRKLKRYYYQLTHPIIGEVWQLHRVTNKHASTELQRTYEITPKRLECLIKDYLNKGYVFISMADVRRVMLKELKINNKFVSITLDDGYEDNYEVAYPIFEKYQIPFCIYVTKQYITGEKETCEDVHFNMLSVDQIKQLLQSPLCTIGGHTLSHRRLSQLDIEEQTKEIMDCQTWLEDLLHISIVDFSYPYGDYNVDTLQIISKSGIRQAVAAWGGDVRKDQSKILCIPRKLVTQISIK